MGAGRTDVVLSKGAKVLSSKFITSHLMCILSLGLYLPRSLRDPCTCVLEFVLNIHRLDGSECLSNSISCPTRYAAWFRRVYCQHDAPLNNGLTLEKC